MSAATLTLDQANTAILKAADDLFYPNGVAAITMADVRDAAGVSLRRVYSLYGGKSELIKAWLGYRHETWTRWFTSSLAQALATGASAPEAIFDVLETWLVETDYRGCGFINTLIESHELTDDHRRIIESHKASLIEHIAQHSTDPHAMGVLVDGAIVQAAIFRSVEPVRAARRVAALIPEPPTKASTQ